MKCDNRQNVFDSVFTLKCDLLLIVTFVIIGCIVYGVKKTERDSTLSWSYGLALFASLLTLIAGIISVVQLKSAGVRL